MDTEAQHRPTKAWSFLTKSPFPTHRSDSASLDIIHRNPSAPFLHNLPATAPPSAPPPITPRLVSSSSPAPHTLLLCHKMLYSLLTIILSVTYVFAQPLTPSPTPTSQQPQVTPAPAIQARCDSGTCTGGSTETTLTAATVTTTIQSITSVPCTTTVFVTDSTTTTSTIYSTETISMTSTITEEGTVYIVHYEPTPIVQSTTYETVIPVTETLTSYWVTESGTAYDSTYTGSTATQGGTTGWGTATSSPCATATATGGGDAGGNAWTHVGAATGGVGATNEAVGLATTSTIGAEAGWATGTAVVAQTGGTSAVWSGSTRHGFDGRLGAVVLAGVVTGLVLTWELRGVL